MPIVEVVEVVNAPRTRVWERIQAVEDFPTFMECVQLVEVLEHQDLEHDRTSVMTAWETELDGCLLRWVEREVRDPAAGRIEFHQVRGDLSSYDGYWQLHARGDVATEVTLVVDFEIGIPLLREALDPYAIRAVRDNSTSMLRSLNRVAGCPAVDVR